MLHFVNNKNTGKVDFAKSFCLKGVQGPAGSVYENFVQSLILEAVQSKSLR